MKADLLLEIGTEEIPAGYLENGLRSFRNLAAEALAEKRIAVDGGLQTFGTPRRLVLIGKGLDLRQKEVYKEVTGPPKAVSYDKDGGPTKAAEGFAKKQGISVDELSTIETSKGEYLCLRRQIPGKPTKEVLTALLPKIVEAIPWPKAMRWGNVCFSFVRPIHWVLALFGGEIIPCTIAGIESGDITRGHRFMAPDQVTVSGVRDYLQTMEDAFVIVDQNERGKRVEAEAKAAAEKAGGILGEDPDLVSTVANLVEYPSAVCGHFDDMFLRLPDPVLTTSMREHQKYFAVYDGNGNLQPNFVAINNTLARDEERVKRGHERVLRARLSDADFFFEEDRKRPLSGRLDDLKGVIYQAQLGSSYNKVKRFTELAEYLGERVLPGNENDIRTVAALCKCDLVTQMVTEFPSLQGTMGREYAKLEGYPEKICIAIHDHYLPDKAGGNLPESKLGALVGLADRMDTISGYFTVGLEPSGTADPFALRRHAIGILRILEVFGWNLSLVDFINKSLSILSREIELDGNATFEKILQFFRERYRQLMLRSGYESEFIEAVISVEFDHIHLLRSRIDQINQYAVKSDEFEALSLTFKRISNILKQQRHGFEVSPELFQDSSESLLWDTYKDIGEKIATCISRHDYVGALDMLVRLRKPVDGLFDGVEIFTKESQLLMENRVGLLQRLEALFLSVADFSKFSI